MSLTASEAGKLVGKSKGAIIKAIHDGRLSADREVNGSFTIQPVELFRAYPVQDGNGHAQVNGVEAQVNVGERFDDDGVHHALRAEIEALRLRLADKEEVIAAKDKVIEVLTQEAARLTAVIAQLAPKQSKPGWWQRLLGGQ